MCSQCSDELEAQGAPSSDQLAAFKRICTKHHPTPGKEVETIDLTEDDGDGVPAPPAKRTVKDTTLPIKQEPSTFGPSLELPAPQSNGAPPPNPVIKSLAQRAQKDPYFKQLMAEVSGGRASDDRLQQFNEYVTIAKAELEREKNVGKRSAEPALDLERPTKVQKLNEAAVPYRGGTRLTWTASGTQRPQQPAEERMTGQPSVREIAERLHARGMTNPVLAAALSNLVKGCASADETRLYHRVWNEIKTSREPSQPSTQISQPAQPVPTAVAVTQSPAVAPNTMLADTQPPLIAKQQTQNEKYSLQLPVNVANMALGWVASRVVLTMDTVPDILARKARTEPIIKSILQNIRWHSDNNAREAEDYDLVVEDATREILQQRPEVGRVSYISAVEVVKLRVDTGKSTTYTSASFDPRHGLVDQGVEPKDHWTLVRRAVTRSDQWRRMNNEGLLQGLVRLYRADPMCAEAIRAMLAGGAIARHEQVFDRVVENIMKELQAPQTIQTGPSKVAHEPTVLKSLNNMYPRVARGPDTSTATIPPSANDRIYSKMPPCTVASRAVILSENGTRLPRDSVPSILASGLRDKLWSADVMPRIAEGTATVKDSEVYDSAVKQAIQTLQSERPGQEVPEYKAAVLEAAQGDSTATNGMTEPLRASGVVSGISCAGAVGSSKVGEDQQALIRKTLMSTKFVDHRNEQWLIAALVPQMNESHLVRDAVQAMTGARGSAADIDFLERTVQRLLNKKPTAGLVKLTVSRSRPTGPAASGTHDLAVARLSDVERRALARCALSKISTTRAPDNQPLITGIVSRTVVHQDFEATVRAIVDGRATATQTQSFQSAMANILHDTRKRPSGISAPPMLNANKALTLLACPNSSVVSSSIVVHALVRKARNDAAFRQLLHVVDAGGASMAKIAEFADLQGELVEEICNGNRSDVDAAGTREQARPAADAMPSASNDGSNARATSIVFRVPSATLSVPDDSSSRQSLAKRILLRLRMPYLAEEPLVITLALRAGEGQVLADAITAVGAGSDTAADTKYFDTWVDSITNWIKDTDPSYVQAANARSIACGPGTQDPAERYVEQLFGTKYERWTVATTNRHTIDNYMGTKRSMYKFAKCVLDRARQRKGTKDNQSPPVIDAFATLVRCDLSLEALVESVRSSQATKVERQRFHDTADRAANMLNPDLRTKVTDADVSFGSGPASAGDFRGVTGTPSLGIRNDQKAKESTSRESPKQYGFTAVGLATRAMTLVLGIDSEHASEEVDPVVKKLAADARSDRKLKALMNDVALGANKTTSIRAFKLRVGRLLAKMVGTEKERWRDVANLDHCDDAETSRRDSLPATATMSRDGVALDYAGSGLSVYAYASKAILQAENRHASSSDPVIEVLAARLRWEPGLKATAKLIADRSSTTSMRDDFDFAVEEAKKIVETNSRDAQRNSGWRDDLKRTNSEMQATMASRRRRLIEETDTPDRDTKMPIVCAATNAVASKAQLLAVEALTLAHLGAAKDAVDPVVRMLASNARSDPMFEQLLNEVAEGAPGLARLEVFQRCVGEYTGTGNVGNTPSWSKASNWTKGAVSATTAPKGHPAIQPRSEEASRPEEASRHIMSELDASALQTLAMRARITLKDPKLPAFGILIEKVIANARADTAFAEVLDHVAGAAGHMRPNEDQLHIFKEYVDSANKILEPEKSQQPADDTKPLPEKLSPEEWPLRFSWSYAKYSDQNARSGKPQSKGSLKATVKYRNHPDCGFNGHPFYHDAPYPLSLLPKATWEAMQNNKPVGASCSFCRRPCKLSALQMKLFLVAERLSWAAGTFGVKARSKNEEALWAVNYELGIEEPVMLSSQETVFGGKQSGKNAWFPYQKKAEAELVMQVVEKANGLSEESWEAWKYLAAEQVRLASDDLEQNMDDEVLIVGEQQVLGDKSSNARRSPRKAFAISPAKALATPPSSAVEKTKSNAGHGVACSSMTLVEMYSSLDKIERMAPMSARFLESYAEKLHAEACKRCWLEQSVAADEDAGDEEGGSPGVDGGRSTESSIPIAPERGVC